jgi:hypothetical protein
MMSIRLGRVGVVGAILSLASIAEAQEVLRQDQAEPQQHPAEPAMAASGNGSFLPETLSAKVGGTRVFAYGSGGYDSSRRGLLIDSAVEAQVWGPFALRFHATYSNDTDRMRPSIAGRAQFLRQARHGVDGSVTVFFKTEGFTEAEGEIETFLSLGRRFENLTVIADLVYGQDPEGNERDGEVHAAVFHQAGWLMYGLDSRVRFAIGTQHGRAATTEPVVDFLGGPVATAATGVGAIFAQVGPSAFQLSTGPTQVGVAVLAGLGAAY